jgi:2-oxoglutarate ferredoxin oxidoreductase subunit alpha
MENSILKKTEDISIVLCGKAGQGIQTVEQILTRLLKLSGFHIFATKEYMSRVRGGSNSTEIRVSSNRVSSLLNRIDILIPFSAAALGHLKKRISNETLILADKEIIADNEDNKYLNWIDISFSGIASDIGGAIYTNIISVGIIAGLFKVGADELDHYIEQFFSTGGKKSVEKNRSAVQKGYEIAQELLHSKKIQIDVAQNADVSGEIIINGAEAVGIGAIAGGCNFISSYPMSPSTGVLTFLSRNAENFNLIAEQVEDEISAINMALGAWYAGGRAMVTTSGGGFALMEEAVGLAGMIESPMVIHVAQRPGPATGLPTRTEQGDLQLVLYSGHGEFPRIILAPGKLEDAADLTHRAFNLADKYQVPVFILTDQYFIDSYYNIPSLNLSETHITQYIEKTDHDYKRYRLTKNGISPRGIPGYGEGLVLADSDEHDEKGHITEDLDLRIAMVDKRLAKLTGITEEAIPPELVGEKDYKVLLIGWGSTFHVIREAMENLGRIDVALLHFKQVYPVHPGTLDYLKKAERTIVIEGNATCQFGSLVKITTGFDIRNKILKYNGIQFTVEELTEQVKAILDQEG